MGLPATNISLSAVNTTLGNSTTASITLNDVRVRSLGSNAGATGSAFSMSSLASKSGTFFSIFNISVDYTTYTGQSGFSLMRPQPLAANYFALSKTDTNTLVFTKLYINGSVQTRTGIRGIASNAISSYTQLKWGSPNSPNLYSVMSVPNPPYENVAVIVKFNKDGQVLNSRGLLQFGSAVGDALVDSNENVYTSLSELGGVQNYVLVSLDPTLTTMRWARTIGNNGVLVPQAVDADNNVYVLVNDFSDDRLRVSKFNSTGTQLFQTTVRPSVGTYGQYGIDLSCNSSGAFAVICQHISVSASSVMLFSSSGVLQWIRNIAVVSTSICNVLIAENGDVYCAGQAASISEAAFVMKFNSAGTLLWQRSITGSVGTTALNRVGPNFNSMALVGGANGVLTMDFVSGYTSGYDSFDNYGILTVPSDGSGTGTYYAAGAEFVYAASSFVVSSDTAVSHAARSINGFALSTPQAITLTTDSAPSLPISIANI